MNQGSELDGNDMFNKGLVFVRVIIIYIYMKIIGYRNKYTFSVISIRTLYVASILLFQFPPIGGDQLKF